MKRVVGLIELGLIQYKQALNIQDRIAERIKNRVDEGINGVLLVLEHPPVYTYGIRREALTPDDEIRLKQLGANVEYADRGGLVTFHGPGQLVAWPVLDLKTFGSGVRCHVHNLEESVILTCHKLGINDVIRDSTYPGIWRGDSKLCALGVRASRYVTTHGLALNVCTDLKWFDHIVPCGIPGRNVSSISKELNTEVTVSEVLPHFLQSFQEAFSCRLTNISLEETDHQPTDMHKQV